MASIRVQRLCILLLCCFLPVALYAQQIDGSSKRLLKKVDKQWKKRASMSAKFTFKRTHRKGYRNGYGVLYQQDDKLSFEVKRPFSMRHAYDGTSFYRLEADNVTKGAPSPMDLFSMVVFYGIGNISDFQAWYDMSKGPKGKHATIQLTRREGQPNYLYPTGVITVNKKTGQVENMTFYNAKQNPTIIVDIVSEKVGKVYVPKKVEFSLRYNGNEISAYRVNYRDHNLAPSYPNKVFDVH